MANTSQTALGTVLACLNFEDSETVADIKGSDFYRIKAVAKREGLEPDTTGVLEIPIAAASRVCFRIQPIRGHNNQRLTYVVVAREYLPDLTKPALVLSLPEALEAGELVLPPPKKSKSKVELDKTKANKLNKWKPIVKK